MRDGTVVGNAGGSTSDDEPPGGLNKWQREGLERAAATWRESGGSGDVPATCGVVITRGALRGVGCPRVAGQGTWHVGYGSCVAHGGAKRLGRAEGAWLMAHVFAREYNCSPWEGLLKAVRIAAGKVAYTEWVIGTATDDLELEGRFGQDDGGILVHPDTGEPLGAGRLRNLSWWVTKNELWVDRLARYSKAAIDAGVAERLVEIERAHAEQVARVLNGVLSAIESDGVVDEVTMSRLRGIMRAQLLQLDAAENGDTHEPVVVDGQAVNGG